MSFEVIIYDRYQRIVYEGVVKSSDKIWNGINSSTSLIVRIPARERRLSALFSTSALVLLNVPPPVRISLFAPKLSDGPE